MRIIQQEDVDAGRYLQSLNQCFGSWGGEREYDLIFRRPYGGHVAERFVLASDDQWLAGSSVSWRYLTTTDGAEELVGIMTGSWTLPEARGRGCFARVIELSREACVKEGARWLLAFVTETNASRRQLERAGSVMIPSWYMWSPEGAARPEGGDADGGLVLVEPSERRAAECWELQSQAREGRTRLSYPDAELWRLQYLERVLPTEMLVHPELGTALVERHSEFDRLLAVIPHDPDKWVDLAAALWSRALGNGRRFFAFTTKREDRDALTERCSLGGIDGFITVLPPAGRDPGEGAALRNWAVESGDRL